MLTILEGSHQVIRIDAVMTLVQRLSHQISWIVAQQGVHSVVKFERNNQLD